MDISIGKFTLESLTTGMYNEPESCFREYIQNAVDSLDMAIQEQIISHEDCRIEIIVDEERRVISVKDNGAGIKQASARNTLLDIGNSTKLHTLNRGFRGIGRLGGLSYCKCLSFCTTAQGEAVKTIVSFDCQKLKALLIPGQGNEHTLQIATIEGSLGLDFRCVILAGLRPLGTHEKVLCLSDFNNVTDEVLLEKQEAFKKNVNFIYTGCTRAKDELTIVLSAHRGESLYMDLLSKWGVKNERICDPVCRLGHTPGMAGRLCVIVSFRSGAAPDGQRAAHTRWVATMTSKRSPQRFIAKLD